MKFSVNMSKRFGKATLMMFFLCMLALPLAIIPFAKAQNPSITLNPSEGSPGTIVLIVISDFKTPCVLSITFGTTNIGTINARTYSTASMEFRVPQVSPGTYTFTVTFSTGGVATKTFTVTQAASPTPTETPVETPIEEPAETPMDIYPTDRPVTTSTEFWSPATIAIICAAIAIASVLTVVYIKRGKQDVSSSQDTSYDRKPTVQEASSYSYRSSVQPARFGTPARTNQMPTNRPQPPFTKICKHCKQTVRDDLNVCPYCFKRLR